MSLLRTGLSLGLGIVLTLPLAGPTSHAVGRAAETCQGFAVTVTGTPGQVLTATEGPDVIDTNDADVVLALAGDDVICTRGDSYVDAGAGDDTVDTTAQAESRVDLGAGADHFIGGPGNDKVRAAGVYDSDEGPLDLDVDVIEAGDGAAHVRSGTGGPNGDQVTTGNGDAEIHWSGTPLPGGYLHLGDGENVLNVVLPMASTRDWVLDASGAASGTDEDILIDLTGRLDVFRIAGRLASAGSLTYLGSDNDETVHVKGYGRNRVVVRVRGGDDRIEAGCRSLRVPSTLSAGPGHDLLNLRSCQRARVDLERHRLNAHLLNGVEDVRLLANVATVIGDEKANRLRAAGCEVRLSGGPGDDRLELIAEDRLPSPACGDVRRLMGGAGADRLVGSRAADVLLGGVGPDIANGAGGIDTCRAEIVRNCERR
jgi:Ca2+-binding RTX toxin-like protein